MRVEFEKHPDGNPDVLITPNQFPYAPETHGCIDRPIAPTVIEQMPPAQLATSTGDSSNNYEARKETDDQIEDIQPQYEDPKLEGTDLMIPLKNPVGVIVLAQQKV